jgi:ribosome biogenesis GTPase
VLAHRGLSFKDSTSIMEDINFAALRRIGFTQHFLASTGQLQPGQRPGRITALQRDRATVHDGIGTIETPLPRAAAAVGDWVLVGRAGAIDAVLDPLNRLTRRTADGRSQPVAANVDTALLVMGLDHDFNPRRIERYIAMVRACEVAPVVVLTKADAGIDVEERREQLRRRLPPSVEIIAVNGHLPEARAQLSAWLGEGQTLVLLGSSGAGKSTLTNTLSGAGQATGAVRRGDSRGRHTTTARSLHLCADGACIIDTPGVRLLAADADSGEVAAAFDDIAALAVECRFHDCRHAGEPGCAVAGRVDADRLANYNKLLREAQRASQTPLERIAERDRWKAISRQAVARSKAKRN